MITINYISGNGSTEREIKALVNSLTVTVHYDENGLPHVVKHAGLDNSENGEEGVDGMGSVEVDANIAPTKNASWIKLY